MNHILKKTVASCAIAATALTAVPSAHAGKRWDRQHEVTRQSDDSDAIAAGILGLAVGAIIVAAITQPEPRDLLDRDLTDGVTPEQALGYFPPAPQDTGYSGAGYDDDGYDDRAYFREPTPPSNWELNDRGWYKYCDDNYRWGKSRGVKNFSCAD